MQRLMQPNQSHHAVHQRVTTIIAQAAKGHCSAEMIVPVCITTGAAEGTLTCNLDRKHRRVSEKNGFPGGKQLGDSQSRPAIALIHRTPLTRVATNVGSAMRPAVQAAVYPRVVSTPPGQSSACWRRGMAESAPLPGQHPPKGTRCSTPHGHVATPGSEETKSDSAVARLALPAYLFRHLPTRSQPNSRW